MATNSFGKSPEPSYTTPGGPSPSPTVAPPNPNPSAPQGTVPVPPKIDAPKYTAGLTSSVGYTPTPYKVEPQGLVQTQLANIVAKDSPLMQQAARIAAQRATERGLVNSSIAVGSAQEAVIGAAAPIANADAASINQAMTNTANQQNAASQFDATAKNNVALANQAANNEALKSNQAAEVQLLNTRMTQDTQMALANLDSRTKMALTQFDNDTRRLLQSNQSASNAYVQTVQNIAQIQQSQTMNAEAKTTAINNQVTLLKQQLAAISSTNTANIQAVQDLDLSLFFEPDGGQPRSQPTPSSAPAPTGGPVASPRTLSPVPTSAPASPPPSPPPAGDVRANMAAGGFVLGGVKPGDTPRRLMPQGSPPPWPGAIYRGTTAEGGNGRQLFDVYY